MKYLRTGKLLLLLLLSSKLYAQQSKSPQVQLSPAFPEPGEGFDRILLLDNGNTCYLHVDKKQGIFVNMYNPAHALTATDTVTSRLWDISAMNETELDGVFNINGQVVLFLQQLVKYQPILYRVILDGQTGKLVQEEKLGELPTVLHHDVFVSGSDASHDFYIAKDPNSGYYAVAAFAGGVIQRNDDLTQRITIQHFAPDHHLIQRYSYILPAADWPYASFLDMAVHGSEKVYLATVAMTIRKKDTTNYVVVSAIQPGQQTFTHTTLPYTANFTGTHGSLQYAATAKRLQLLLTEMADKSGKTDLVNMYMSSFDGASLALLHSQPVEREKVTAFAKAHMKYTADYTGVPEAFITQPDGTSTLLMESMSHFTQGNNSRSNLHTNLGDIGITTLDENGKVKNGYGLIKMQTANGAYEPFYLQRRSKGQWNFRNVIQALNTSPYLSYDYLAGTHGTYIIFNDYLQYLDVGGVYQDKKPLRFLTDANTVCYHIDGDKQELLYLFGKPETFKGYYCMLGASDYNGKDATYVTLMITRKGEEKKASIAWIQF